MLTNLKIGARLGLGFGLILALLMVVMGVGLNRMDAIGENTKEIVEHYNMQERLAYDMSEQQHVVSRLIRTIILDSDPSEKKAYDEKLEEARKEYDQAASKLQATLRSEEAKALFGTVQSAREKVRPANTKVLDLSLKNGRDKEAAAVLIDEVQPLANALQKDIDALLGFLKKATVTRYEEAKHAQSQATTYMIGISLVALLAGVALAWFITRSVTQPLAAVGAVIATVAQGDLTQRVDIHSKDELGELGRILNTTNEGLREMVLQIQESALAISTASGEISMGNTDLSRRTEEQAASLEETASSMEQITSNVNQTADNAKSANLESNKARQVAQDGGAAVTQVIAAMEAINQSSAKINEIIGVVDEIAFQTNLLALNAAVEAARAGEQGRGFAVVAAEVRNLAKRSADAAKEIKGLIRESVAKSTDGNKVAAHAGETIAEVVANVQRVTSLVSEIANATQEQSTGLNEINKAVVSMDEVTQQNAALVEEAAASAESMDAQAHALTEIVARFKTGVEVRREAPKARTTVTSQSAPKPAARPTRAALKRPSARPELAQAKQPVTVPVNGEDGSWEAF